MKRTLLAASLAALITAPVYAFYGTAGYTYYDGFSDQKDQEANGGQLKLGQQFGNWNADLTSEYASSTSVDYGDFSRVEGGLTYSRPIGHFVGFGRVAVGQSWNDSNNFTYYSVQPGVGYRFADGLVEVDLSYRYRNSFDPNTYQFETNSGIVGGTVWMNKNQGITFNYEYVAKDQNYNKFSLNYTYVF